MHQFRISKIFIKSQEVENDGFSKAAEPEHLSPKTERNIYRFQYSFSGGRLPLPLSHLPNTADLDHLAGVSGKKTDGKQLFKPFTQGNPPISMKSKTLRTTLATPVAPPPNARTCPNSVRQSVWSSPQATWKLKQVEVGQLNSHSSGCPVVLCLVKPGLDASQLVSWCNWGNSNTFQENEH